MPQLDIPEEEPQEEEEPQPQKSAGERVEEKKEQLEKTKEKIGQIRRLGKGWNKYNEVSKEQGFWRGLRAGYNTYRGVEAGAGTAGAGAAGAGAGAGAAGAAGGTAAVAGEAAGGTAATAAAVEGAPVIVVVIICILAIALIVGLIGIFVYWKNNYGRTNYQAPSLSKDDDRLALLKAASSTATISAFGVAGLTIETYQRIKGPVNTILQLYNLSKDLQNLNKTSENPLISRALSAEPVDEQLKKYVLDLDADTQALNGITSPTEIQRQTTKINEDLSNIENYYQGKKTAVPGEFSTAAAEIRKNLAVLSAYTYTESKASTIDPNYTTILAKKPPLQLNPADAQMLLDSLDPNYTGPKPDIRIVRLLNYLAETTHIKGGAAVSWENLRISKIFQDDPTNKETTVPEEKTNVSAHNSGQAIDISEIGYVACTRRLRLFGKGIRKNPCRVAYQTPYRPFGQTADIQGSLYRDVINNIDYQTIKDELGLENISGGNLENVAYQVGVAYLLEEMGVAPGFAKDEISKNLIAESYLAQASGISTDEIHSILQENPETKDTKTALGRAIMAKQLDLPVGSIQGKNFNEIVQSTGLAYEKQAFGLGYTSWNGNLTNEDVGRAVLEKRLGSSDEKNVKAQVQNSPGGADKMFYLADGTSKDFLDGKKSIDDYTKDVGGAYLHNFTATYQNNGIDRAFGFPAGTVAALMRSDTTAQVRIGSIVLSRAFGLNDPNATFYADANNLKLNLGHVDTTPLKFQISVEDLALIISTDDPNKRSEALQRVANSQWERMRNSYLDDKIQRALEKNNLNLNLNFQQILDATKDKNKRDAFLASLGDQVLAEVFRKNAPTINHYKLTVKDLDDVKNNRWWAVAFRVGGSKLEDILDLPPNTLQPIFEGTVSPEVGMANAGIYKFSEAIGIDLTGIKVDESWFGSSSLKENFGRAAIESRGLKKGTFTGDINEVITKNGAAKVASVFGLTEAELNGLKNKQLSGPDYAAVREKLNRQAAILRTTGDNLEKFIQGGLNAPALAQEIGKARVESLGEAGIKAALETVFDELDIYDPDGSLEKNVLKAINGETTNKEEIMSAFGKVYGRKIDEALGINETIKFNGKDMGFAEVLLSDPRNADVHLVEFGATRLAEMIIPDSQNNLYNASDLRKTLVSTLRDLYQNDTISEDTELQFIGTVASTIQRITNIADNSDARTLARGNWQKGAQYIGYAQLSRFAAEAFHNNNHPPDQALYSYQSIKMMFEGDTVAAQKAYGDVAMNPHGTTTPDQAYRDTINATRNQARSDLAFMIGDLQLKQIDPNIPAGTVEAFTTGNTAMQQDVALEYASRTIKVGSKSLYDWGMNAEVLREMADGIDVKDTSAQHAIQSALERVFHQQLPEGTVSAIVAYVNTQDLSQIKNVGQAWAMDRVGGYLDHQIGWNKGTSQMLYNTYTDYKAGKLGNIGKGDLIVLVFDRSGLGKAADRALGLPPGMSSAILTGALTGNWIQLGYAIVGWAMSWKCENAQAIASYNVREILKEILEAPDRPTQIATFGKGIDENTVNYLYGINPGDFLLDEDKPADQSTATQVSLSDRVSAKFGQLSKISRQGLWAGDPNIFYNHIHVGY